MLIFSYKYIISKFTLPLLSPVGTIAYLYIRTRGREGQLLHRMRIGNDATGMLRECYGNRSARESQTLPSLPS